MVPDVEDVALVERICAAVDGLPLAIELAAARTRSFSLPEVLDQVGDDAGALARVGRGPADHRRTLRSAVEWSHRLLTPAEQLLHRRLSVLPGPFTLPVATAVIGPDLDVAEVPTVLARLVHRCMLVVTRPSRAGRPSTFHQLETVRAHARSVLHDLGEVDATVARRDGWVRHLLAERPRLGRPEEAAWYDVVDDAYATVRATLENSLTAPVDHAVIVEGTELAWFWYYRGKVHEGARWLDAAVVHAAPGPSGLIVRLTHATTKMLLGRVEEASELIAAALTEGPPERGPMLPSVAEAFLEASGSCWSTSSWELCRTVNEHVRPLVATVADPDLDIVAEAMRHVPELAGSDLAALADRAVALHERAVALDNVCATWMACAILNIVALLRRDPEAGLLWTERVIDATRRLGAGGTGVYVEALANFLVMRGDLTEAVQLYSWAYLQTRRNGMVWPARPLTPQFLDQARDGLSPEDHRQAWEQGAAFTLDEIVARRRSQSPPTTASE